MISLRVGTLSYHLDSLQYPAQLTLRGVKRKGEKKGRKLKAESVSLESISDTKL